MPIGAITPSYVVLDSAQLLPRNSITGMVCYLYLILRSFLLYYSGLPLSIAYKLNLNG